MSANHPCAVEDCTDQAKPGQLMCWPHWKRLPRNLQFDVNSTWRRYRYEQEPYLEAREAAIAYYRVGGAGNAAPAQGSLL